MVEGVVLILNVVIVGVHVLLVKVLKITFLLIINESISQVVGGTVGRVSYFVIEHSFENIEVVHL